MMIFYKHKLHKTYLVLLFLVCFITSCASDDIKYDNKYIDKVLINELTNWLAETDGVCFHYIVPKLFEKSLSSPNIFYSVMIKDTLLYNDFLEMLDPAVFTNLNDTVTVHLEKKRLKSIDTFKKIKVDSAFIKLNEKMIIALESLRVRFID